MLGAQEIVTAAEAAAIEAGLWQVWDEVDAGTFQLTVADEDVHTGVERRLRELIGRDAGRLHTGRSRNDQVITDVRLWTKGALLALTAGTIELATALLDVAAAHDDYVMPGYTHLQRAQPVLLSHHLLAYVAMFARDLDRLRDAYRRTDVMALGAGALAGVTYPINRVMTARDLGFSQIATNSMDAVSDRDFILDTLYACSLIAVHVSRLSEEVILWTSAEFRFMELADAFSTGSSIMPQKKNADIAELARGKTGRVFGHLFGLLTVVKGLPLTFNKDFQEDKEALFDAVDTMLAVLDVYPPMIRTATFHRDRMAAAAIADFSLATDVADLLAKHNVPFREAHEVVGKLVRQCVECGITFAELSDEEWTAAHPLFVTVRPPLTAEESIAARDVPGGTAPNRVRAARIEAATKVTEASEWLSEHASAYGAVMRRPGNGYANEKEAP
jgi:argininosuccinate lyase